MIRDPMVYVRLAFVLAIALIIVLMVPIKGAGAQEAKSSYALAFPKPIGSPNKTGSEFVWGVVSTYKGTYGKDKCVPIDGDRGRISVLRSVQFADGSFGFVGTDVWSNEDASRACMTLIDFTKLKKQGSYF